MLWAAEYVHLPLHAVHSLTGCLPICHKIKAHLKLHDFGLAGVSVLQVRDSTAFEDELHTESF